jgi:hypothetical protein
MNKGFLQQGFIKCVGKPNEKKITAGSHAFCLWPLPGSAFQNSDERINAARAPKTPHPLMKESRSPYRGIASTTEIATDSRLESEATDTPARWAVRASK